jgi:hypothetical protein
VLKIRRKNNRKVAKLARALVVLEEHARLTRPPRRKPTKISLGA